MTLKFDSFVGLRLGTFTTQVDARAASFSLSSGAVAPVTVLQNGEPGNDTEDTAQTIGSDTLVVGHIAVSGDQDFYNLSLNGLPRGTQIAVFLHTAPGTDLDLTVSKPARQSFFSTPGRVDPRRLDSDRGRRRRLHERLAAAGDAAGRAGRLDSRRLDPRGLDPGRQHLGQPRRRERGCADHHRRTRPASRRSASAATTARRARASTSCA